MNTVRSPTPNMGLFNMASVAKNTNAAVNAVANAATNTVVAATNTVANAMNGANTVKNNLLSGSVFNTSSSSGPSTIHLLIIFVLIILISFIAIFWQSIYRGLGVLYESIRQFFGAAQAPLPRTAELPPDDTMNHRPVAPQDVNTDKHSIVEKVLPGRKEVFNISKNAYTYHDAEPLCKALGAELATYEQMKQAYGKGADWCNYGWVKGQMAVYPTQEETWKQIQEGSEEQRDSCGRPGLNGGFFDNPDLRYGVNCYGPKPDQTNHDANTITSGEGAPLSPGGLEFEKKVSHYRGEANSISILPWNGNSWSS